jgi:hypothetical protein
MQRRFKRRATQRRSTLERKQQRAAKASGRLQ